MAWSPLAKKDNYMLIRAIKAWVAQERQLNMVRRLFGAAPTRKHRNYVNNLAMRLLELHMKQGYTYEMIESLIDGKKTK